MKDSFLSFLEPNSVMSTGGAICFVSGLLLIFQARRIDEYRNVLITMAFSLIGGAIALGLVVADSGQNHPIRLYLANIIGTLTYIGAMSCFAHLYRPEMKRDIQYGIVAIWFVGCFIFVEGKSFYMWNQAIRIGLLLYTTQFVFSSRDQVAPGLRWLAMFILCISAAGMAPQLVALHDLPDGAVVQLADPSTEGVLSQAVLWALSPSIAYAFVTSVIFTRISERLRESANLDMLTGAHSRRYLIEKGARILSESESTLPDSAASLLLIDLDHFKSINDTWGHLTGDAVLKHCVKCIREVVRTTDNIVGRYGGEEFCVMLPNTPLNGASRVAERIRNHLAITPYQMGTESITTTISIGVVHQESGGTLDSMLAVADRRLYRAKETGRNTVVDSDGLLGSGGTIPV